MMAYLLIHTLLTLVVLLVLRVMSSSPPRLRMWLSMFGMALWLVPLPLFRPSLPATSNPSPLIYTLQVLGGAPSEAPTEHAGLTQMHASSQKPFSWSKVLVLALLLAGMAKWLFQRWLHLRWLRALHQDGGQKWEFAHRNQLVPIFLMAGSGAMTTGIFRKQIWMGRDHLGGSEWDALLAHEQTHLRNHDNLWTEVIHLLECLLWWNPAALYLGRQARFLMELSCDQACIRILDREHYQRALAKAFHQQVLNPMPFAGLVTAAQGSNHQGISRLKLLDRSFHMNRKHGLSLGLLLLFSSLCIAFPKPQPSALIGSSGAVNEPSAEAIPRVGQTGVTPPVFIHKVKPEFPEKAAKISLQGYVIAEATLKKDGTMDDIVILRGIGKGKFGFEDATVTALKQWTFEPGKVNGVPADVRMTLKIDFKLDHQSSELKIQGWKAPGFKEIPEGSTPPIAKAPAYYFSPELEKRNLNVPVVVELDSLGQVLSFTPDAGVMSQLLYPDLAMESLEDLVDQIVWSPAIVEGTATACYLKLDLAIALGDPSSQK